MRATPAVLLEILRSRLWVGPSIGAVLAALAALGLVWLDGADVPLGLHLDIGADSARAVLTAISGAMISFTALVFSVTMLVLQSASTQLSPRVMRTFLRDRFNQSVLGLFVATFVFSLLVLASVSDERVPPSGVVAAVALVLVAVFAFVAYIDHMAHDIRPTSVIESIALETRSIIDAVHPDPHRSAAPRERAAHRKMSGLPSQALEGTVVTWSGASGYVQGIDQERLLSFAGDRNEDLRLTAGIGEFLVHGSPFLVLPLSEPRTVEATDLGLGEVVQVGSDRTMAEDPTFGFRQLVDVALRALSPSLNDPSTASLVVDRLHELLHQLQSRDIDSPRTLSRGANPTLRIPAPDWDAYVHLATSEIGMACRAQPRTRDHLRQVIVALLGDAADDRRPALRQVLAELDGEPTTRESP